MARNKRALIVHIIDITFLFVGTLEELFSSNHFLSKKYLQLWILKYCSQFFTCWYGLLRFKSLGKLTCTSAGETFVSQNKYLQYLPISAQNNTVKLLSQVTLITLIAKLDIEKLVECATRHLSHWRRERNFAYFYVRCIVALLYMFYGY